MNRRALKLFELMLDAYRKTAEETARTIPEAELDLIPDQMETLLEVQHALNEAYPEEDRLGSLLATDVAGLLHHLTDLHFDIMSGRYEAAGRALRFLWERVFRSHLADTDHIGHTLVEKVNWLEERKTTWRDGIAPTLLKLFPTDDVTVGEFHFRTIWNRLNQVAHPTGPWRFSTVGESARFAWPHFDADLCLQLLAHVNEVMAMVWLLVLHQFPKVRGTFADPALVFNSFPLLKTLLN